MIQSVPRDQTQEHILEETMKGMPVPRGRIQECTGEETNDVPLSQVKEETTEAVMLIRITERVQNPTVEQIVSLPIAQIQEELVEVIQPQLRC